MKKTRLLILIAFAGLALSACNGASLPVSTQYTEEELADLGGTIETPWVDYVLPATDVSFPEEDMVVNLNKGDTYTYHPIISPKSATIEALTFTVEDENIAHVINGVLTATAGGSTNIVVSSKENAFDPITLLVNVTVPITDFTVNKEALDLGYGYTEQLSVTYVPADTTQEGVTFASDDANIVSVSEDGLVTAGKTTGTTKIKVTSPYINTIKEVTVSVEDKVIHVASVTIANKQATLALDKSFALNAVVAPENAENKGIDYVSSDEQVAVVDAAGNVSALAVGKTTITAKSQEIPTIKDEFELNVYAITADTIDVPAELNLIVNNTEQLRPVFKKAGEVVTPSRSKLVYETDHPEIATVTAAGLVAAKAEGTAHITVKDEFANAPLELEAVVTVNVKKDVVTYNITGFADWTPNDGADVFAWIWGGDAGYPGAWVKVNLSYEGANNDYSNVTGSFVAPRNIEGLTLARCKNGTVTPDWEVKDDSDGRIYNKTADLVAGTTALVAPEWVDYPEPEQLEGFGIRFNNGVSVVGEDAGVDAQGRQQYSLSAVHFAEGAKFSIYDFSNNAGWIEPVEGYSFGGDSAESENWKSYLALGDSEYTVVAEFTADIFLKISLGGNSIYFGLSAAPVVADAYAVKIGSTTTELVEAAADPTREGELKQFKATGLDVKAGEAIVFYANNVAISANFGPDADDTEKSLFNNYHGTLETSYTIQADNAAADVYLHVYQDGLSFWISGGNSATHYEEPDLPTEGYGLLFKGGLNYYLAADKGEEEGYHQYLVSYEHFTAGSEFRLYDFANKAGWTVDIDPASFGGEAGDYVEIYDGYYVAKVEFYADVWIKLKQDADQIYFGLKPTPIVLASTYKVQLGDVATELAKEDLTPEEKAAGKIGRFTATLDVVANADLAFLGDDVVIADRIGANADDLTPGEEQYNNYKKNNESTKIQANKSDAFIELNVYKEGYSFWISGGDSEDHSIAPVTYAVSFELDLSAFDGWDPVVEDVSLYVYGTDAYAPTAWAECLGNLDTGTVTVNVAEGKNLTGAVLYFSQAGETKQTTDIALDIDAAGEYIINFDPHWDMEQGKFDLVTISAKALTLNKTEVSVEKDASDSTVIATNWTGTLTASSNHEDIATVSINTTTGVVTINGVAAGSATITVSDGTTNKTVDVTVTNPVVTFAVTFELDTTVFDGWTPEVEDISIYVFGTGEYIPDAWAACEGNLDSGSKTFNIPSDKDITGAVIYFKQSGETKQTTDIAVNITAAGTYVVNFDPHWDSTEGKFDLVTISVKQLVVNKDFVSVVKDANDTTVVASNWMGPLTASSNHEDIATVTINTTTGVATITGVSVGSAQITISDGITNKVVDVTVTNPVVTYAVTFEFDTSVFDGWDPAVSGVSLYVFGDGNYIPVEWASCSGNLGTGSVTFNIAAGKNITGAVLYFTQGGQTKQSTDIAVNITAAGTYVVNFVSHWEKVSVDPEVWKLDQITITPKP